MTPVNWERLPGETVQELVAALILMDRPQGNPITPSRGDRGIDLRLRTPDGIAVYQIKKYAARLTAKQAKDIEQSWTTFCEEGLPNLGDSVASWTLVLPWDPTNERLEWLARLTEGCGFPVHWMGRTQLDVLAAARGDIVEYYLGDGAEQVKALMAQAIGAAKDLPNMPSGGVLLDAVRDRTLHLAHALDAVDPFYSYSFQVRDGAMPTALGPETDADASATFATYEQLDDGKHLALLVRPRSPWSTWLRPIERTIGFSIEPGSVEAAAVEKFLQYGAPLDRIPFTTLNAKGPPGTTGRDSGLVSVVPISTPNADLELRVRVPDSEVLTVPLVKATITSGLTEDGFRMAATDATGILGVEILGHNASTEMTVNLTASGWDGKPVAKVLPLLRALRALTTGACVEIAASGALAFASGAWPDSPPLLSPGVAEWIEAIGIIQRHARRPISIPAHSSEQETQSVRRALALLSGQVLPISEDTIIVGVNESTSLPTNDSAFLAHSPLVVQLGGETIELDRGEVLYSRRVHFEVEDQPGLVRVVGLEPMTVRAVSSGWRAPEPGSGWGQLPSKNQ